MGGDDSRCRGRCLDAAATAGGGGGRGGSGSMGGQGGGGAKSRMTLVRSSFFHRFPKSSFQCKKGVRGPTLKRKTLEERKKASLRHTTVKPGA
jgi:hypothetical protein